MLARVDPIIMKKLQLFVDAVPLMPLIRAKFTLLFKYEQTVTSCVNVFRLWTF